MKRGAVLQSLAILAALPLISACSRGKQLSVPARSPVKPLDKPHVEWLGLVSPAAYRVFEEDTEPPGSSVLNKEDRAGTFICAACYLPLFDSTNRYESGTGWPSFTQAVARHLGTRRDFRNIMPHGIPLCALRRPSGSRL